MIKKAKTIIVGITGSIAAYRACDIVNELKKESFNVKVIMTKEAAEFMTPLTMQTLSGNEVYIDMFKRPEIWNPIHTSLANEASALLIAPATANIIGKLASGICDDLLTCVAYATRAPVLIAPAMNDGMYNHKVVRENIVKLEKMGYSFVGPVKGRLACGYEALGHIAATSDIVDRVKKILK